MNNVYAFIVAHMVEKVNSKDTKYPRISRVIGGKLN